MEAGGGAATLNPMPVADNRNVCRTLIVDDESLFRDHVASLLRGESDFSVIGEAANGSQALDQIARLRPDLVFLDIRMREISGVQVARETTDPSASPQPLVVFTTAYSEYAIDGFDVGAVDYLKKPYSRRRFRQALARIRTALLHRERHATSLHVRHCDRVLKISVDDIVRLEAWDDYVKVYTVHGRYLSASSLHGLLQSLDPRRFVRIHRSHAINIACVASARRHDPRRLEVAMTSGDRVVASRTHTPPLRRLLTD